MFAYRIKQKVYIRPGDTGLIDFSEKKIVNTNIPRSNKTFRSINNGSPADAVGVWTTY